MRYSGFFIVLFICIGSFLSANAQLRLPAVLSSGMVLQQKDSVTLWGWTYPGAKVSVTTGWNNATTTTNATNGAIWSMKVLTPSAGGPYDITIESGETIRLNDVLIGEVWVCSGQSNMEWSYNAGEKDLRNEMDAVKNPNIRFFHVPKTTSAYPQDDVRAKWTPCDSNTVKNFTAVGYFFGKRLNDSLKVPVGLINSSWGGTPAEVWTPAERIENDSELLAASDKLNKTSTGWPWLQGCTYNAMIAPLSNFRIAGAIWYQGESNVRSNSTYEKLLTTMIDSWRKTFKKNIPFYYVQIAPYDYGDSSNINGALLQEAQTKAMTYPNVGMVVITDLIDSVTNIHPSRKKEVGNRLANWALAQTYNHTGLAYKSPLFEGAGKKSGKVEISFQEVPTGFKLKGKNVEGFTISDPFGQWYPASAKIEGKKIIVWNRKVKDPVEVRYAFSNTLIGNVFSSEGLPLTPFRTGRL
ncbi:MAG: sialate O-acetylesterase [Chitinophagaceae bacterium]|nr:sialate O-acetylesterase [Chitinophagaceae bacterium]